MVHRERHERASRLLVLTVALTLLGVSACVDDTLALGQVEQRIGATPGMVNLGTVAFGATSAPAPIRVVAGYGESDQILGITSNCAAVGVTLTGGALPQYVYFLDLGALGGVIYIEYGFDVRFTGLVAGTSTCLVTVDMMASADLVIPVTGTTLPPPREITLVQPASGTINFGQVPINTSSGGADVIVRNDGGSDLTISAAAVASGPFMLTAGASGPLAGGQSRTFSLVCHPTAAGPASGSFRVQSDDPDEPVVMVNLSCTGITSNVTISPSPLSFAPVRVGESSPERTVSIGNTGALAVTVSAIAIDNPTFALVNPPTLPAVVSTMSPLSTRVVFTPQVEGDVTGTLTITYDGGQTRTTAISGSGRVSTFSITPAGMVDFGPVCGGDSADEVFLVLNTGSGDYQVTGLASDSAAFAPTLVTPSALPATVPAAGAGAVTFSVRATPTLLGPAAGAITVTTDIPGLAPQVVEVHATGIAAGVSATPTSLDLGTVIVGTLGTEVRLDLSNCAATAQPITAAVIDGVDAAEVELVTSPAEAMVPAQGMVRYGLRLRPSTVGNKAATLVIRHGGGETAVPLVGVGVVLDDGTDGEAEDRGSYYACRASGAGGSWLLVLAGLGWVCNRRRPARAKTRAHGHGFLQSS